MTEGLEPILQTKERHRRLESKSSSAERKNLHLCFSSFLYYFVKIPLRMKSLVIYLIRGLIITAIHIQILISIEICTHTYIERFAMRQI